MEVEKHNLFDSLELLVDDLHIKEVKNIISMLSKINDYKHELEEDLCESSIYENIAFQLKQEFKILDFKVIKTQDNITTSLYQHGNSSYFNYTVTNTIATNIIMQIILDGDKLTKYKKICLNSYFKEISQVLYIQDILVDTQKNTNIDQLTKLKTRISFQEEMKVLIPLALREKMKIGVLLINIDRFRAVNDEHGDEFGDRFLQMYADEIKENIRNSDIAVRFGGGEFLVLLVNIDSEIKTIEIANKLRENLSKRYLETINGDSFKKTVRIGVSMFPEDSEAIDDVVKNAQIALGDAKQSGRNQVLRFSTSYESSIEFF
ncbi:MAG: GGDEF domain-containing protein [Campylobacterota bacterium]|nr:GGDEF domain-containing protein [Campylobacterota bacterium]